MEEPSVRTIHRTFKYKLQLTAEQEATVAFVLRRCCELYNAALQERREAWRMRGVSITVAGQSAQLPDIKEARSEYRDVHSQVLQDVLPRLDRAFHAFFRRIQAGETPGYPRFKSSTRYDSCTYKQFGNGGTLDNGFLVLSKIGRLAVRWSRPLQGTPKSVTIRREADGWYACFSCDQVPSKPLPRTGQETGIDLGIESFATLANGKPMENPRIFHVAEMQLKRAQRRVSRRVEGSNRRRKAVKILAKAHAKLRRARQDFHHKEARKLIQAYDTIYHESLQVTNLLKNHHLAKAIADAGWSAFLSILTFKAVEAGKQAVAVIPAFTSQACSGCGAFVAKGLSVRWHACSECGTSLHRDHNAARNILKARTRPPCGRAGRSGANVAGCRMRRLSISRMYAGECQVDTGRRTGLQCGRLHRGAWEEDDSGVGGRL
jgi:putative transposase